MTRIMRDSDTPSAIPMRGTDIAAGYLTGPGTWPPGAFAKFRRKEKARIDCRGTVPGRADILDVEGGCTEVSRAAGWVKKRKAAFPGAYPPVIYCNRDTLTRVLPAMRAAGLRRVKDYRLWIATLDGTKRLPDMKGVIAVQYKRAPDKGEAPGPAIATGHFDESIVFDDRWHPGDDLPYTGKQIQDWIKKGVAAQLIAGPTKKDIVDLVSQGVAEGLITPIDRSGITVAQGAQAAVHAQEAVAGLAQQLADLTALVKALPAARPAPAVTQPPSTRQPPSTTQAPAGASTPAGNGAAPRTG